MRRSVVRHHRGLNAAAAAAAASGLVCAFERPVSQAAQRSHAGAQHEAIPPHAHPALGACPIANLRGHAPVLGDPGRACVGCLCLTDTSPAFSEACRERYSRARGRGCLDAQGNTSIMGLICDLRGLRKHNYDILRVLGSSTSCALEFPAAVCRQKYDRMMNA